MKTKDKEVKTNEEPSELIELARKAKDEPSHANLLLAERALLLELLKEQFPSRSEQELLEELLAFGA